LLKKKMPPIFFLFAIGICASLDWEKNGGNEMDDVFVEYHYLPIGWWKKKSWKKYFVENFKSGLKMSLVMSWTNI
jgi:hypothetical protein